MKEKKYLIRSSFSLTIIILFIGLSFFSSVCSVKIISNDYETIRVDDDGDGDYKKIQDAIDNASIGDIIEVYSGNYLYENVTVDKKITLKGINHELGDGNGVGKPLIIGEIDFQQQDKGLITITVEGCSISGFHLKEKEGGYCNNGIVLMSDNNNVFQNDVENTNFGINLREASNNIIYDNFVYGSGYGIILDFSDNNKIFSNYIKDDGYGIELWYCADNNIIYQNVIDDCSVKGIEVSGISGEYYNNPIFENEILRCSIGISIGKAGDYDSGDIYYNNISHCGVGIKNIRDYQKIYQNNISLCGTGIKNGYENNDHHYFEGCEIYKNNISNCKFGERSISAGLILINTLSSNISMNNIVGNVENGILIQTSSYNNVFCNNINNNKKSGMFIWWGSSYNNVSRNDIINNEESGIYMVWGSYNNKIFENNVTDNKEYGIYISDSLFNSIYHNNFINNFKNVDCEFYYPCYPWTNFNYWNLNYSNNGGGNYWSDYNGVDENGDNVGDIPYIIPDNFWNPLTNDKDKYPLMEPSGRPKSRQYSIDRLFNRIFDKFLEGFPILQRLLNKIR